MVKREAIAQRFISLRPVLITMGRRHHCIELYYLSTLKDQPTRYKYKKVEIKFQAKELLGSSRGGGQPCPD